MTSSERRMPKASSLSQSLMADSEGERPKDIKQMGKITSRAPIVEIVETPLEAGSKHAKRKEKERRSKAAADLKAAADSTQEEEASQRKARKLATTSRSHSSDAEAEVNSEQQLVVTKGQPDDKEPGELRGDEDSGQTSGMVVETNNEWEYKPTAMMDRSDGMDLKGKRDHIVHVIRSCPELRL